MAEVEDMEKLLRRGDQEHSVCVEQLVIWGWSGDEVLKACDVMARAGENPGV